MEDARCGRAQALGQAVRSAPSGGRTLWRLTLLGTVLWLAVACSEQGAGGEWVLEIDYSRTPVNEPDGPGTPDTATATLTLAEADLQIPDSGTVRYEVVGGTVTYDPSFTDRFCQVEGDPITFDVTPEMTGISEVSFDTTTSPNRYTSYISISGPEYEAEWSCRAGTGEDAPEGYQDPETRTGHVNLILLDIEEEEGATLSADGISASGTWVRENTSNPGSIRESSYTLTSSP